MNEPKPRDGVWRSNGLSADFRLLYAVPGSTNAYRVQTAAGDSYAYADELTWDCKINEVTLREMAKALP